MTLTKALLFLKNIYVNSVVRDVYTQACYATCLFLDGLGGNLSDVVFDNDNFDSTNTSTGAVVYIAGDSTGGVDNMNFIGGAIQHAGVGQSLLFINGNGSTSTVGLFFRGTAFETSALGSIGDAIQIWDASQVVIEPGYTTGSAGVNFIKIAESASGKTHDIEVLHLLTAAAWTNTINDTIHGLTYNNRTILRYDLPGSTILP